MKILITFVAFALVQVLGAPQKTVRVKPISTLSYTNNVYGRRGNERKFGYAYETENGISQSSQGELRLVGKDEVMVMSGSYSFTGLDGLLYIVDWYADETGFHPSAPHLPVAPEIPFPEQAAAVAAQIKFAAENPEPFNSNDIDIRSFQSTVG